jgi:hypothetical protein
MSADTCNPERHTRPPLPPSRNELHVLHIEGAPAGKWFLQWTIDKAWKTPRRLVRQVNQVGKLQTIRNPFRPRPACLAGTPGLVATASAPPRQPRNLSLLPGKPARGQEIGRSCVANQPFAPAGQAGEGQEIGRSCVANQPFAHARQAGEGAAKAGPSPRRPDSCSSKNRPFAGNCEEDSVSQLLRNR